MRGLVNTAIVAQVSNTSCYISCLLNLLLQLFSSVLLTSCQCVLAEADNVTGLMTYISQQHRPRLDDFAVHFSRT
jgi:hypothetical protein